MKNLMNWVKYFTDTPQMQPMPNRPDQVRNSPGGYVFAAEEWKRLERFLILGSERGTFYLGETVLTRENASAVAKCLKQDGERVVKTVVEISTAGRAPKNDPALFVLAMAATPEFANERTNALALSVLPQVARTASHLAAFIGFVQELRGWGRGLRRSVSAWYTERPARELAYQMLKYQNRSGFTHRDLLRLAHPKAPTAAHQELFGWAVRGALTGNAYSDLSQIEAFERVKRATSAEEVVRLVRSAKLTHEMVPAEWKSSAAVWSALLEEMPYTAMLRSLGKLAEAGLLQPNARATRTVAERLVDRARLKKARVHPIAILTALLVYRQGRGVRGRLEWVPTAEVTDALDAAFYLAFENVEPTNRRIYLAIDASGSMQSSAVNGSPFLTAAMAAAAMAMCLARAEKSAVIAAFHERVWHVDISPKDRLDRAVDAIRREPRGTDASLPFADAQARKLEIDAFVLVTDSETWAGRTHPVQALHAYRRSSGLPAKLAVLATAANRFSIADPLDLHQLDVAGFDASVPSILREFLLMA